MSRQGTKTKYSLSGGSQVFVAAEVVRELRLIPGKTEFDQQYDIEADEIIFKPIRSGGRTDAK